MVRFLMAILCPWAVIWGLYTVSLFIDPAGVCGDPSAMCCFFLRRLFMMPAFGFLFAVLLFSPGFLIMTFVAGRSGKWRSFHWVSGWIVTGMSAAIPIGTLLAIADRHVIALNVKNGIVSKMAQEFGILTIALGFFCLLCGFCHWVMLNRSKPVS